MSLVVSDLALSIADTTDAYFDIATQWSGDVRRLTRLRIELRAIMRQSPFCNGFSFARDLENAYRQMWAAKCGQYAGH